MNLLKRIVGYSPYLLILFVVLPVFVFAKAQSDFLGIHELLWAFVNNVFGFFIGVAGIMLDYAVNEYVIGFGDAWRTGIGGAIDDSWKVVRDVFNITFIFGLVWLGFRMILNSGDSSTRKTLITLIIAALLVNFSLFITKFVVDFTNILATEIAQAFVETGSPIGDASTGDAEISARFMQLFGLSSVWDWNPTNNGSLTVAAKAPLTYIFGTAILFLIGAFAFAAGAIMLIIRFAALCIYMVFSPLMFLGMVFPGLQSVSSKYWSGFLGRAFYAPAYLILIYLAAFIMGSLNSTAASFANALVNPQQDEVSRTIAPFVLTCVFLIASVVVAGKMSTTGANTAMGIMKNVQGRAQRGLKNGALFVPRRAARGTVGATANVARRMDNRLLASDTKFSKFGRGALATVGLDARTRDNMIESGRNAKMGTNYSTADNQKNRTNQVKRRNEQQNKRKRSQELDENLDVLNDTTATTDQLNTAMETLAKTIKGMSDDEITDTSFERLTDRDFALNLSEKQIETLEKSGKYSNDQITTIKDARNAAQINVAETGSAKVVDETAAVKQAANVEMQSASNAPGATPTQIAAFDNAELIRERLVSGNSQDVGKMKPAVFMEPDMYRSITPEMLEQRLRSGIKDTERIAIRDAVSTHLGIAPGTPPPINTQWDTWYQRSSNAVRLFA